MRGHIFYQRRPQYFLAFVFILVNFSGSVAMQELTDFSNIEGWAADRHGQAFATFRRGCAAVVRGGRSSSSAAMKYVCAHAIDLPHDLSDYDARLFFETNFTAQNIAPFPVLSGLFTGYYEPDIRASRTRSGKYAAAILGPPSDLISTHGLQGTQLLKGVTHALRRNGKLVVAPTRAEINNGALAGDAPVIAWAADPIDVFFLHVQGSGRLQFEDGSSERITYAGKNGHPYLSIGKLLVDRGDMAVEQVSMDSLRRWLAADLERATELMEQNRSYIFFCTIDEKIPNLGPVGQLQVQLTPQRSLAVDLAHFAPNTPIWIETKLPPISQNSEVEFRQLMVAQDTGSAIKGLVRGDIFFGSGGGAGAIAGKMRAPGRITVLMPQCQDC